MSCVLISAMFCSQYILAFVVFLFFPWSCFPSFLSLSPSCFNRRLSRQDLFLARYTFGLRFFCQYFEGLICLAFSSALILSCVFNSLLYTCSCCFMLLELYSFPLFCQLSSSFSSSFFFTFLSCLYDSLFVFVFYRFPIVFFSLLFFPLVC